MKQGLVVRSALTAVAMLAIAGATFAADMEKAPSSVSKSPPVAASSASCTDSSGKPVTDPAVCASGACKDATGKPVSDPSVCASVSGGPRSSAGWDLKSNTK